MVQSPLTAFLREECGAARLGWLALGTALFAGLALAPGHHDRVQAHEAGTLAPVSAGPIDDAGRQRLEQALQGMGAAELSLTYARIHASFRALLSHHDLGAARALVDYAIITETEMHLRRIARPEGTASARDMLLLYELVL
ncbi:MAG: hypothetical protein JJT95_02090 [Pararhodobacter sp.]|nr:hypothetical protein [Pararhodobacter sp.]